MKIKITMRSYDDFYNIVSLICSLYQKGQFEEARGLLDPAFELAKNTDQSSEDFRRLITKLYGVAGDIYGELGEFNLSLKFYENFQCLKMQLKTNLFKDSKPSESIKLYQFRRFSDYSLANLINRELTLSRPIIMNDVVDSLINVWLDSPSFGATARHKGHLKPFRESFRDYRIASLCEDNISKNQFAIQNTLMWSHYADEHKGFCIAYIFHSDDFRHDDFSNQTASRLFRMTYNDSNTNPIDFNKLDKPLSTTQAFLTKSIDWSYENEVRLLQYCPKNGETRVQYSLSPKTQIPAIYFGYRCPDADIQVIKKLLENTDVKFYKMDIDYSNVYKLKYREI